MYDIRYIDVHAHTQFATYDADRDAVVQRAFDAGVWMINVGTEYRTSEAGIVLAKKYSEGVYATVGLHPNHAEPAYHDKKELREDQIPLGEDFDYERYKILALHPKVVGIGECGLDYYRTTNHEAGSIKQKDIFLKQVELSKEVGKPLMIHCRNAFPDLIALLYASRSMLYVPSGVIHFFSGTKDDARKLLDLGFSFSFGGVITFTRDYDEVVKYIPLERILLETDAPYITPTPFRGKRNEPAYVVEVTKRLAELKKVSLEDIGRVTTENTRTIFSI